MCPGQQKPWIRAWRHCCVHESEINFPEQCLLFKVEMSAHYTQKEDDCLVLNSNTVYVYCGKAASEAQKKVAHGLSRMILKRKKSGSSTMIQRSKFRSFAQAHPGDATQSLFRRIRFNDSDTQFLITFHKVRSMSVFEFIRNQGESYFCRLFRAAQIR